MGHQPTVFDKIKMGALMGGTVGATMGFIGGGVNVLVNGPGPNGYLRTIGSFMAKSGGFFASLMAIGSVIRNEERNGSTFNYRLKEHPQIKISQFRREKAYLDLLNASNKEL